MDVKYYCDFNTDNTPKSFYTTEFFPDGVGIPKTATEITKEQHTFFMDNQGRVAWNGNDFVFYNKQTTEEDLLLYADTKRKLIEQEGITVDGQLFSTTRDSQAMIQQTLSSVILVPDLPLDWKNPDGTFTELSGDGLKSIAICIATYVASTFTMLKVVSSQIKDGSIKSYSEIDSFFSVNINKSYKTK